MNMISSSPTGEGKPDAHDGKLKLAIIGLGFIAKHQYLPAIMQMNEIELKAIVDIDIELLNRFQQKYQVSQACTSLDELLKLDIDAAIVLTSKNLNATISRRLLSAGIHVLTEKPVATIFEDAVENVAIAKRKGVIYMVGMNRRFTDVYMMAKRTIEGRKIELCIGKKIRSSHYKAQRPLLDYGIHVLDAMCWLCGESFSKVSASANYEDPMYETSLNASIDFGSGTKGLFILNNRAGMWSEKVELMGEDITVEIDAPYSIKIIKDNVVSEHRMNVQGFESSFDYFGFKEQIKHFISCIRQRDKCRTTAESNLNTLGLIQSIYKDCGLPY